VGPMQDVVRVAPGGGTVATGEPAMPVPDDDRPPHGGWDDRRPASDIERFGPSREHDARDRGVAGKPARLFGVDRTGVIELGGFPRLELPDFLAITPKHLRRHPHRYLRTLPGHTRSIRPNQPMPAKPR